MKNSAIRIWLIFINYFDCFCVIYHQLMQACKLSLWTPLSMLSIRIWLIFINYFIAFALSIISQSKLANSVCGRHCRCCSWNTVKMLHSHCNGQMKYNSAYFSVPTLQTFWALCKSCGSAVWCDRPVTHNYWYALFNILLSIVGFLLCF